MKAIMKIYSRKVIHKNLINIVNSTLGINIVIFSLVVTAIVVIRFVVLGVYVFPGYVALSHRKQQHQQGTTTIGGVYFEHYSQYPPIDVVYTWVNGSDPVWLNKKRKWARVHRQEMLLENLTATLATRNIVFNISNSSHEMQLLELLSKNSTMFQEDDADDATAANRYRDNDELKYSLRSLVKNAPWIRHVYLVTDNQVPSWLNIKSNHITVIIVHHPIILLYMHISMFHIVFCVYRWCHIQLFS